MNRVGFEPNSFARSPLVRGEHLSYRRYGLTPIPAWLALLTDDGEEGMAVERCRSVPFRFVAAILIISRCDVALAQTWDIDPSGSDAILSAVRWLEDALLGPVAKAVATIAVASIGFMMLTGRANWRHGVTVIAGCFIVFGASSIAAAIVHMADQGSDAVLQQATPYSPPLPPTPRPSPNGDDPYAGASVNRR